MRFSGGFQETYKPLFFEDKPDRLFYCIAVNDSSIIHNGLSQGYLSITMRCDSPYIYSPVYLSPQYDLTNNIIKFPIAIENKGHFNLYPEISIEKIGIGHVTITNISNGGDIFEVRDLTDREKIYINCEHEKIETDIWCLSV
jgi:phage-related protein